MNFLLSAACSFGAGLAAEAADDGPEAAGG